MTYPFARTTEEVLRYLELHPCEVCGGRDFGLDSVLFSDGTQWLRRYAGACTQCGTQREFVFRVPAEPLPSAPPGYARFGAAEPSQLLDAGQWLELADDYGRGYPADAALIAPADLPRARRRLAYALAALDEAAKFAPPGSDSVPGSVLWTDSGRALWQREPYRFRLAVIDAYRETYRELIAALNPPAPFFGAALANVPETSGDELVTDPATGLHRLSGNQIRRAARILVAAEPLLRLTEPHWAAEQLGWRPAAQQRYAGVLGVDAGFGLTGASNAELRQDIKNRGVQSATVSLCDRAAPPSDAGTRFCQDVFAAAARELTAEYGPRTASVPGSRPELSWRLADVTLTLWQGIVAVDLTVLRNEDGDELARRAAEQQ